MKRVLFVTESLVRGGMEHELVDVANALAVRDYEVTILLYDENTELKSDLDSRIRVKMKERNPLKLMRRMPYFHRFYRNDKWEKRVSAVRLHRYYVGHEKYDVEVGFYRGPSIKIVSGSTCRKTQKLAWVHTDFKLCDPKSITRFFNNMDEVRTAYNCFDRVICVSEKARQSFEEVIKPAPGKSIVVYNMVDTEGIRKKATGDCDLVKERFTIVTVGRLVYEKGYDLLLNVVKRLNDQQYVFDLWIVGGGREEQALRQQIAVNGLTNVILTGMQANPYPYVRMADLFVCSSRREGFSLAVAESMVLGVPVLTTRCTGPTEILEEGTYGIIVENNEESLYQGLKYVLEHPETLARYRNSCKERGNSFDSEKIIEQITDLF